MKTLSLIILLMSSSAICAQQFFGMKAGLNSSNLTSIEPVPHFKDGQGLLQAVTYEYFFTSHFSVGADLMYNLRGFSHLVKVRDYATYEVVVGRETYRYRYFSIPVKVGYTFGNRLFGFVSAGAMPSFFMEGTTTAPIFENNKVDYLTYISSRGVKKFELGAIGEVGAGISMRRFRIYASVIVQEALTKSFEKRNTTLDDMRHQAIALTGGINCRVGN
jgi:hypothetical protein